MVHGPSGGRRHHAARDENYLIEMFSFIYYSVSGEMSSRAAKRGGEDAEARPLYGEIGFDVRTQRDLSARGRKRVQRPLPR